MSLSTYDGDETHLLSWNEFLAFLAGRRNPYVTAILLPKMPASQLNASDAAATNIKNCLLDELTNAAREEELQVGAVDQEGGSNPR